MEALTDKVKETLNLASAPGTTAAAAAIPTHLTEHTVGHAPVANAASWREALATTIVPSTPHLLTKTLVFKPKVAKSAQTVLIMVVALENTATSAAHVAKSAGEKEARLATADLLRETFGVTVDQVSPLAVSKENAASVQVLLDHNLVKATELLAFHPSDEARTVFITAKQLQDYLADTGVKVTEVEFPLGGDAVGKAEAKKATAKPVKKEAVKQEDDGETKLKITVEKDKDFSSWYQQVLTKSDMLDYYDVSGCYIMKPWSYAVWEAIQRWFDREIKKMGVENAYFPMFVSKRVLEKEKDHIEGFAPEVAWVTKAGESDLEQPIAIRPTSETVMYPYYQKWIRSHRDLPLKLNQWNSVVRWEFKHPQPFLRTREFLWQEGHTAHLTEALAMEEVYVILDLYRRVYEDLLAVPVIKGQKSENEKFAGGLRTTTVEGFIPATGRGVQAGTSHCLGQNFSKMFDIFVEDPNGASGDRLYVWQNSWGLSTRTIGCMVMVHGDDRGLVMPPRVSLTQVVVIPAGMTSSVAEEVKQGILKRVGEAEKALLEVDLRVKADTRKEYTPGWKYNYWELKGVPIRIEIGPQDLKKDQFTLVRRDTLTRSTHPFSTLTQTILTMLDTIHSDMFSRAQQIRDEHVKKLTEWQDVVPALDAKNLILVPWCREGDCEDAIKERSKRSENTVGEAEDEKAPSMGAKSLCIPFDQPEEGVKGLKCIQCGKEALVWGLFGRSY